MGEVALKLSPSSATDFKSCPQLFKFRAIERLPEPTSPAAARGSLVHLVLERLFTLVPESRTPEGAEALLHATWEELRRDGGDEAFRPEGAGERSWLEDSRHLLRNYFRLEDPRTHDVRRL
ncbi:MAG: RecB family exonuclease, partial [Actinomycetota bacterium]